MLFDSKGIYVLKQICTIGGLLVAGAAGVLTTGSPVSGQVPAWGGGCCGSSHNFSRHHGHNWNRQEISTLNPIRLRVEGWNDNVVGIRPGHYGDLGLALGTTIGNGRGGNN